MRDNAKNVILSPSEHITEQSALDDSLWFAVAHLQFVLHIVSWSTGSTGPEYSQAGAAVQLRVSSFRTSKAQR